MAHDTQGHVWFSELSPSRIGVIDPSSGAGATEFAAPTQLGDPANLYGLVVTARGEVWFASSGANALIRYEPAGRVYTVFQLSVPSSVPYGLTLGPDGKLWFTASGSTASGSTASGSGANYIGAMQV